MDHVFNHAHSCINLHDGFYIRTSPQATGKALRFNGMKESLGLRRTSEVPSFSLRPQTTSNVALVLQKNRDFGGQNKQIDQSRQRRRNGLQRVLESNSCS